MHVASERDPARSTWSAMAAMPRASWIAVLIFLSGCGGGNDVTAPVSSTPATVSIHEPNSTPLPTVVSIDRGATGNPVSVRVVRSANGDGFAVWLAHDGTRHNLWANRHRGAAWGNAVSIETRDADIDHFDVAVDASGNATVVWNEPTGGSGDVVSVRFDTAAGTWDAPVVLSHWQGSPRPRVTSDATGAVLAVWGQSAVGRFFDPVRGAWQPLAVIEQSTFGTGSSDGPVPLLDGSGNALVVYRNERQSSSLLASNYYSRSIGSWGKLPPDAVEEILGEIPNSAALFSDSIQLALAGGGDFLAAWQGTNDFLPDPHAEIRVARFTSRTRTWSTAERVERGSELKQNFQLQRMASDAAGRTHLLWTESDGVRSVLKAIRVDGAACNSPEVIDRAVGGGAASADLAVDAGGNALAIWQQFEGGLPNDGSRSNIAVSRFDSTMQLWTKAVFAETQAGNATSPSASASGGQALLA